MSRQISNNYHAQLFIGSHEGFSEENSLLQPLSIDTNTLEFDLTKFNDIRALRFDPVNYSCYIKIIALKIVFEDDDIESLRYTCNAAERSEGRLWFETEDPNIEVHLPDGSKTISKFIAQFQLISIGHEAVTTLRTFNEKLKLLQEEISSLQKEKQETESKFQNVDDIISTIRYEYQEQLKIKNEKLNQLEQQFKGFQNTQEDAKDKIELLEQENASKAQIISKSEAQYESLDKEYKKAQAQLDTSRSDLESLSKALGQAEINELNLKKELLELKKELKTQTQILKSHKTRSSNQTVQINQISAKIFELQKDLNSKNQQIQTINKQIKARNQRIQELEAVELELGNNLLTLQHQYNIDTIHAQNRANQLDDIYNSLSYKLGFLMTAPLRKVYDIFAKKPQPELLNNNEGISQNSDTLSSGDNAEKQQEGNSVILQKKLPVLRTLQEQLRLDLERGSVKKKQLKILYISPHLPDYDTSSGGKRATRQLSLLAEEHKVYVYTLGDKPQKHQDKLKEINVELLDSPELDDIDIDTHPYEEISSAVEELDAIIFAWYTTFYQSKKIAELYPNAKIIFDTIDVHWIREQRLIGVDQDYTLENVLANKRNEINAYGQGDFVWAVTEKDKQAIIDEIPTANVKVVSNVHEIENTKYNKAKNKNILFFGGYRHIPNISAIKKLVLEILPELRKRVPDAQVIIAGSHASEEIQDLGKLDGVIFKGYIEEDELSQLYADSFITAVPLLAGAGIKGKICEAVAYSLPIVTNAIGNEGINLEHEVDGLIAETNEEFVTCLANALSGKYDFDQFTTKAQAKLEALVGPDAVRDAMLDSIAPEVSICIVTYNRKNLLERCVESIIRNTKYPRYKILVHSNGCVDGTRKYLEETAEKHKQLIPILSDSNDVFVLPNNAMMNRFPDNDVVLVNNDTYLMEGWLTELVDAAYQRKDIGISGSKILYPDGRLQEFGSELYNNYSGNNIGKFQDPNQEQYLKIERRGYVSGCSMFIKRSTLNRIGVFDEVFHPCYCEDSDLCYTAWENGIETVVTPYSVIYHDEGGTSGTDTSSGFKSFQEINFIKFYQKHKGKPNGIAWGLDKISGDQILKAASTAYKNEIGQLLLNGTHAGNNAYIKRDFITFDNASDFRKKRMLNIAMMRKRSEVESILFKNFPSAFSISGLDPISKLETTFHIGPERTYNADGFRLPNLRESFMDNESLLNGRLRATAFMLHKLTKHLDVKSIHLTEQKTNFFNYIDQNYEYVTGSEDGVLHNIDLSAVPEINDIKLNDFKLANNVDVIVSLESLQFYEDYKSVLHQFYNNLNESGTLIMTVPFIHHLDYNLARTNNNEGILEHNVEPIFYPNRLNEDAQLLCFYHFGWELLDDLRSIGFKDVKLNSIWSLYFGILGGDNCIITAKK